MKGRQRLLLFIVVFMILAGYMGPTAVRFLFADRSWISDFGYSKNEIHKLSFHLQGDRSCPEIPVLINGRKFKLGFDTGCGTGLMLTDVMKKKIDYELLGRTEQLNRDGSHRGWSERVSIKEITVFGEAYENIQTDISDWRMFSSSKFNGIIGLEYFQARAITLDYRGRRIAITNRPIETSKLDPDKYIILPLHNSTIEGQTTLPFFEVEYDRRSVIAYLDTGKNYSYLCNPWCEFSMSDQPAGFTDVPIKVGTMEITLKGVAQVNNLAQARDLPYPTMIELNSDQIWKLGLVVTIDLIDNRIIFRIK